MKTIVEPGFQFGQFTLIEKWGISAKTRKPTWLCQCVCGTRKVVRLASLKRGSVTSCGCMRKNKAKEREAIAIQDRTLVRRITELAKQSETTPKAWVEELLEDWIRENRSNKFTPDVDRHTERSQEDDGWSQFEDVFQPGEIQEALS